ncbi:MAG TPA: sugar ABC transporter permease [Thermomicrobiales bacterium]|jgi:multiple sugar transport system permease protein|nr:sugar ABC transporter permease [Thermomicrobiales bacterium]
MVGDTGWRRAAWVSLFVLPGLIGLSLFTIGPILASLVLTLFDWDLLTDPSFIGFANFERLWHDDDFWAALRHTLIFIVGYVPLVMILSLGLALALNTRMRGLAALRTAFFLPVVSSWVAVALLWTWLFNPRYGLINYGLDLVGIDGPRWLYDPLWAMPAIILTSVWKDLGFVMVLFLAGLQAIPRDYHEAAELDGASAARRLWTITIPLLAPTTFFVTVISLINSFQVFTQVWVMTEGGPAGSTTVLVERVVRHAFSYGEMGYAATISWVLCLIVFAITIVQLRLQRRGAFDA